MHFTTSEDKMSEFSHVDEQGKAKMVDVSEKPEQRRVALAAGKIFLHPETLQMIVQNQMKKGDVLTVAEIAGIQAAKQTALLIPLCHTLMLQKVEVKTHVESDGVAIECQAVSIGQTGVEMEALTGVSVALLTIYDMCKAVDKSMVLGEIRLVEKIKSSII